VTRTGQHGYATLNDVSNRAAVLEREASIHTEPEAPPGTDLWALANGYLSVTPLQAMLTDYRQIERLAPALNRAFERVPDRPPLAGA
jgi:broad specificity polyphosphatase/5'/3'-nucleotidase SurE